MKYIVGISIKMDVNILIHVNKWVETYIYIYKQTDRWMGSDIRSTKTRRGGEPEFHLGQHT